MENQHEFLIKYLNDQLVLESHTLEVVESQMKDPEVINTPNVHAVLKEIHSAVSSNVQGLKSVNKNYDGSNKNIASSLIETLTDFSGAITGLYSKLRTEKVSKMLRDDYTALSMTCLTYSMLFTTACSFDNIEISEMASKNLHRLPPLVMKLNSLVPEVVKMELLANGYSVKDNDVAERAVKDSKSAWNQKEG